MAEKNKADNKKVDNKNFKGAPPSPPAKKKSRRMLIVLMSLLLLLILAVGGFIAGVYFKFIDIHSLAANWNLQQYPVIGKYLSQPQTNFEPVDLSEEGGQGETVNPQSVAVLPPNQSTAAVQLPEVKKVDDEELKKQEKLKQQEEAKRVSKLARLYGGMKAEEAVLILNQMDDADVLAILGKMEEEQVSKILAQFEPKRAAVLSQVMLKGKNTN